MITSFFVDVACDLPERRAGALFLEFANAAVSWVGQIIPGPAIMDGSRGPQRPTVRTDIDVARIVVRTRAEITELTDTLRDNLSEIVQHGKRADSIVKNMLLHSREGSGEHRVIDVNALVEESLNLAYHGARAEKQGFRINMERSFDPAAGQVD